LFSYIEQFANNKDGEEEKEKELLKDESIEPQQNCSVSNEMQLTSDCDESLESDCSGDEKGKTLLI